MYKINIEKETEKNTYYRKVLYTNKYQQLVVMNLLPYEEIGNEKHNGSQFFRFEEGSGHAVVNHEKFLLKPGGSLIVNPRTYHNIIAGKNGLKLYTIYSLPQHKRNTREKYKMEE